MNTDNMNHLLKWLEAGAPHFIFDMYYGLTKIEDIDVEDHHEVQLETKPDCGTVCCLAGWASMQVDPCQDLSWPDIRRRALKFLGLPDNEGWYGHPLFKNPPFQATAADAAEAVRRVIANPNDPDPWRIYE